MTTPGLSVIIPCFNEADGLAAVLGDLHRALENLPIPHEVIVVDDGSTDGTAQRIDPASCRLLQHEVTLGYGAALKTGGRTARHDLIAIIDGDGTYPAARLPDLVAQIGEADMVVGSRTGARVHIHWTRRIGKVILTALANYLTGRRIPDLNSGLRVVRREVWDRFERYYPSGFSLTTTITLAALTSGYRVRFVPIDYHPRVGRSKIRPLRDMLGFIQTILRTVMYFDPLKVFVPVSVGLLALGLGLGFITLILQNVFHYGRFLDTTTVLLVVASLQMLAIGVLADLISKRLP